LIIGTAGHIDHGKTSLVKALTGIDTGQGFHQRGLAVVDVTCGSDDQGNTMSR
jgi:selenocysteine-specific translation elongation factor